MLQNSQKTPIAMLVSIRCSPATTSYLTLSESSAVAVEGIELLLFANNTKSMIIANKIGILVHGVWQGCAFHTIRCASRNCCISTNDNQCIVWFSGGEPTPLHRWLGVFIGFFGVATAVVVAMH